ncbi:hypothetical protein PWT90_05928 [Aphanocladium album]|nr:hypothetical protein PWT90_05928 [Aphanocladium album]
MDGHVKRFTKTFSFKTPIIKVNSIPVRRDDGNEEDEHTPLAQVPPSSSKASSITVVEKDVYNLEPIVHTHGWKPETMQSPVLVSLALASLLIAALLEILAQKSAAEGALSIVPTADDISGLVSFAYLYLPTIVAVLYSLAWNWVDLDVKRMQPWLELSREGGATGRDSLFLDYPVDFVAFVPFKAAKRRHWAVFYSGTIVVFVFWLLTPMQGAVFGTAPVLSTHDVNMSYPLTLMDSSEQAAVLSQAVLNRGYAITWLNQEYPAFTTPEYTLRPFSPPAALAGDAANWTGTTVKYWTDLHCWPAQMQAPDREGPVETAFTDGRGCNATGIVPHACIPQAPVHKMMYIGYQGSAWADYSLRNPDCGAGAWNEFLATWAVYRNDTERATVRAAFCETSYWKQAVLATVSAATRRPVAGGIRPLAEPERLREAEFNSSAFQYLLGAGVSSVDMPRDLPFTTLLEHYSRLPNVSIEYPLSPMIGFALGYQNYTVDQYANLTIMAESFTSVHRMLFSVAYSHLLVNATTTPTAAEGQAFVAQYGIVVNRTFSALVEGFLGLVAVMSLMLLWVCRHSACKLTGEPSSLDALVRLARNSEELRGLFSRTGHMSDDELRLRLGGYRFRLHCGCPAGSATPTLSVVGRPDYDDQASKEELIQKDFNQPGYLAPVKPFVLRSASGAIFWVVIATALGVIIYMKKADAAFGGLLRPSTNREVNQILTNYLPTAFSTLVEPIWVLLNRFYCMLQPFYDLLDAKRQRETHKAMKSQYTALPPQLAFYRAIRARHLLLAAVCVTALLGNVLAVGLGALFNELPKHVTYHDRVFSPRYQTSIADAGIAAFVHKVESVYPSRYYDPFYVVMANMSYGTTLPAWSTPEFRFLPLDVEHAADDPTGTGFFTGETTGVGVDPGCRAVGVYKSDNTPVRIPMRYPNSRTEADGACARTYLPYPVLLNDTRYSMPEGRVAVETVDTVTEDYNSTVCDETLILGWSRSDVRNRTGAIQSSILACSPTLRMARFRVVFDAAGHVRAATPVSNYTSAWPYQNGTRATQPLVSVLNYSIRNRQSPWHNDTVARDWMNYLLVLQRGGDRSTLEATAPLPDAATLLPYVEAVYKLVFVAFLSLTPEVFAVAAPGAGAETGLQTVEETRIFVSTSAFVVCMAILGIYLVMAMVYYCVAVRLFLPRMPSTVGSMLSYIAPSSIATEEGPLRRAGRDALRFGRYTGHDGRAQIGINYADKTVPLDLKKLGHGDTRPSKLRWPRLGTSRKRLSTWL